MQVLIREMARFDQSEFFVHLISSEMNKDV